MTATGPQDQIVLTWPSASPGAYSAVKTQVPRGHQTHLVPAEQRQRGPLTAGGCGPLGAWVGPTPGSAYLGTGALPEQGRGCAHR